MSFLLLAALSLWAAAADPLQPVADLISLNKFWDAYELLNGMVDSNRSLALILLRAQCAARMEMPHECLADSLTVLDSPSCDAASRKLALSYRAAAHLQLGDLSSARADAAAASDRRTLARINEASRLNETSLAECQEGRLSDAKRSLDALLRLAPKSAEALRRRAEIAWAEGDRATFARLTAGLVGDAELLHRRGLVLFCADEFGEARRCLEGNASALLAALDEVEATLPKIDQANERDDDDGADMAFKKCRAAALAFCDSRSQLGQNLDWEGLGYLRKRQNRTGLIELLGRLIESTGNRGFMLERARLWLELQDFDAAMRDFQLVLAHFPADQEASEGYTIAFDAKRAANRVDYYKVLDLAKDATSDQIQAAYKRLARTWHPDRFSDKQQKREAEQMMKICNQAYDVLNNPKKKELYDSGGDPAELEEAEQGFPFPGFPPGFPFERFFGPDGRPRANVQFEFGFD